MAGASSQPPNSRRRCKKVEVATVQLKRAMDGSGFIQCNVCDTLVPAGTFDMHKCSQDSKTKKYLEAEVTGTKGKKVRDPNAPKRPGSSFFLFMESFRKEYKEAHPVAKGGSMVAKAGGYRWRSMTDQERKIYVDRAAELKEEYEKATDKYNKEKENAESGNRG